ncbi:hypothetical protein C7S14_1876 [Burkholderia cepacia]|nr:hypothetical protein C7S14_1876 [Burkholderia cepacia]
MQRGGFAHVRLLLCSFRMGEMIRGTEGKKDPKWVGVWA